MLLCATVVLGCAKVPLSIAATLPSSLIAPQTGDQLLNSPPFHVSSHLPKDVDLESGMMSTFPSHRARGF